MKTSLVEQYAENFNRIKENEKKIETLKHELEEKKQELKILAVILEQLKEERRKNNE